MTVKNSNAFFRGKKDYNILIPQGTPSPAPLGLGHCRSTGIPHCAGRSGLVPVSAATSGTGCVWSPAEQTWAWSPTASALYHMACSVHEASLATWGSSLSEIIRNPRSLLFSAMFSGRLFWSTLWAEGGEGEKKHQWPWRREECLQRRGQKGIRTMFPLDAILIPLCFTASHQLRPD